MEKQVKYAIHEIPDLQRVPDPVSPYDASLKTIVVDNGSYECKVGWSSDSTPRMIFRSHSTKVRGQKGGEICVGNDIANYEAAGWMPLKSPFEKNIASHPELQEHIFDHIFTKLGFHAADASRIDHQIVVTEPICNPNYYRQYMSELLFECYGVPSVVYGIDSMLSLEHNIPKVQNAMVVGLGHAVCHVIPVLNNEIQFKRSKRISLGGQNVVATLQRLLQLKHPHLAVTINNLRSEYLAHTFCEFALDYDEAVSSFRDADHHHVKSNATTRIQLPLNSIQGSASATTTSGKMDVCYAILQRVESVMSQKYKSKLIDSQEKLKQLAVIHEMAVCEDDLRKRTFTLSELGYDSLEEVEATMSMLRHRIETTLQSDLPPCVDLCHFSDPDSWLISLRKLREDLKSRISDSAQRVVGDQDRLSDEDILDRIELIIFETEREFRRPSVLNLDNLKSSSAISRFYQLNLSTEKFRAPEILFQPAAILGLEQAGLVETVDRVFQQFEIGEQREMAQKIFVTGGPACFPGLKERLEREIRAIRPFQSDFNVIMARQPALDAWNGAKLIANDESVREFAVSRTDYDEFGPDFIKKFKWSNIYAPSPLVVRI